MTLLPAELFKRLCINGAIKRSRPSKSNADFCPLAKLYTPDGPCTWLLTHIHEAEPHLAFGLIDDGDGEPGMGYVDLHQLARLVGPMGLPVRCDADFFIDIPISQLAERAAFIGYIVL